MTTAPRVHGALSAASATAADERGTRRGTPGALDARRGERARASAAGPLVLKLGGRALSAPGALTTFAASLARRSSSALLVHGGGAEVTDWCARLGIESRFENGLRVTDDATLEVTAAVLAGLANKRLVAALRAAGVNAVGLAALDGGVLQVRRHPDAALGAVGVPTGADASLLRLLLAAGRVPVLASLAADGEALLNVNADDAAAAIAAAVGASQLVLLSDTPGLKLGGQVVRALDGAQLNAAIASPDVTGGMKPKLAAAAAAIEGGVPVVHIADWQGDATLEAVCSGGAPGTRIVAAHATLEDVRG